MQCDQKSFFSVAMLVQIEFRITNNVSYAI